MNTVTRNLIISLLISCASVAAQSVSAVYKIDDLLKRVSHPDTIYVVNFWATWCKPCIQELPTFDSLQAQTQDQKVKVLLVTLDFKEDLHSKTNPFLKKRGVHAECVLLDEVNGNDFINRIDPRWSGAIPATLFRHGDKVSFIEKKTHLKELVENLGMVR